MQSSWCPAPHTQVSITAIFVALLALVLGSAAALGRPFAPLPGAL